MRVLLDTHTFLWWITDSPKLSSKARSVIQDGNNEIFFSAASGWEIAIKCQLGKLTLPANPDVYLAEQLVQHSLQALPISLSHALHVTSLPCLHRDPFDRMLVAQSQLERLPIVTADLLITQYAVDSVW